MPEPAPDARGRLLRALTRKPSRAQVVVAVLLALLGFAAALQIRTTHSDVAYAGARRGDLVQLLDSVDAAGDRLDAQASELTATRNRLRSTTARNEEARKATRKDADDLAILAGTTAAYGPGVSVTIADSDKTVTASILLNAIEELRDAGAEAISINGKTRVIAQTTFSDGPERTIRVDGRVVGRPYVIEAIGAPRTLGQAVRFRGGLSDQVEAVGGSVEVKSLDRVEITALAEPSQHEYAQPGS